MSSRKRNEWLDAEESEDDNRDYDSEEESRARALRSTKRQKVTHDDTEDEDVDGFESDEEGNDDRHEDEDEIKIGDSKELARLESLAKAVPVSNAKLDKPLALPTAPKKDKSGIIYLSRCPPFMKPSVLRSLLTPYGAVGRIFLTPESSTQRTQRLKSGGTRRKLFLDGWVEFLKKKDAKFVAENLNAQTMGGKKRSRWHDEVWNIKYLSGVKWSHLVEQIQNENAERQARMRAEIAQSKRENQQFLEDVERGKIGKTMAERKKQRGKKDEEETVADDAPQKKQKAPKREFKQKEVKTKADKVPEPGQDVQRVLSKMF
ncbi:pre-rRNA-processing protein-like protein esf2 [Sporormia fimetaria CBS 119925]|uniref:18S rRNA factor 2 n=1 Tax=Sporormia fimetaria CBS 119925 TaxID=1340428 RepID=A0A6A6VBY0_9PLEO|nr:pre-rRNA-processing protein-like protein esf2 [Sporormia fimetaria CBS 119925]